MTGATIFSAVEVDRYICASCGFVEEWIREEDLGELAASRKVRKMDN